MLAFDPGKRVGELHPGFVVTIKSAKVVTEEEKVRDIQVGFPGDAGETVVAAGPLHEHGIHESRLELRGPSADQRLVAKEAVAAAARRANAASIERLADQHVQIGRILDGIANRKSVCVVELVVHLNEPVIDIGGLQNIQTLWRDPEALLHEVDCACERTAGTITIAAINILDEDRGVGR